MKTSGVSSPAASAEETDPHSSTRLALLDAAERLYSLNGVEGTSVRDITSAAGANLGAVNYHFGSKDRLTLEVFARRLEPVNRERIRRLDELESSSGKKKLKLEQIIDALIRPSLESEYESTPKCDDFMRLISRCFQEPNAELKKFVEAQFGEVAQRFDSAILRSVPGLPPGELFWCMNFLFGALHHGQERWLRFDHLPHPRGVHPLKVDREGFVQRIISFVAAGLRAAVPK